MPSYSWDASYLPLSNLKSGIGGVEGTVAMMSIIKDSHNSDKDPGRAVAKASLKPIQTIRRNGLIADIRVATYHNFTCAWHKCKRPIKPGSRYYSVTIGGGGLGSIKFPDRVHEECVDPFLDYNYGRGPK
jgi:hypothetical protein